MPCTNRLFNGTFSSTNQMVKIGGRGRGGTKFFKGGGGGGTIYFSWKKGDQMFQRGTNFLILVSPGPFFLKYLVRGGLFWGGPLLRDSSRLLQCSCHHCLHLPCSIVLPLIPASSARSSCNCSHIILLCVLL